MANIGDKFDHKFCKGYQIEILDVTNRGYKVRERIINSRRKKYREDGVIKYYFKSDMTQWEKVA